MDKLFYNVAGFDLEMVMLGKAPEFQSLLRAMRIVSATDATVLVTGESGTGKELLAQALHQNTRRRDKSFITVNCAALPTQLAESELFGHRKGTFNGASSDSNGKVQAANGGTLFLDEIGELPQAVQGGLADGIRRLCLQDGLVDLVQDTQPGGLPFKPLLRLLPLH